MMSLSNIVFVLVLAIILTEAKKRSTCREPSTLKNFDITRILGHWYEYSRHHHDFEAGCDCLTSEVVAIDANSLQVSSCCQMTDVSNTTQKCDIGINKAWLINPTAKEAMFQYTRTGSTVESNVWIVDSDYENYLIANGCDRVSDGEEREIFWIFSRESKVNAVQVKKIDEVLLTHNFEKNKIIPQKHGVELCTSKRPKHAMSDRS